MTRRCHTVSAFEVGDGLFARFNTVQKIALVAAVVPHAVPRFIFHRLGPRFGFARFEFGFLLRAANGMTARDDPCDYIVWRYFRVAPHFKAAAGKRHGSVGAVEDDSPHALAP